MPTMLPLHTTAAPSLDHTVQFYDDEQRLFDAAGRFLAGGIEAGQAIVVIATASHRDGLVRSLAAHGIDVDGRRCAGQITLLDANEVLATFMDGELPDDRRFATSVGGIIDRTLASSGRASVRAYGEMVDVLWRGGRSEAAIRVEELWNDLVAARPVALLCAYAMGPFYRESTDRDVHAVCSRHADVLVAESPAAAAQPHPAGDPEAELDHRRRLEAALRVALAARRRAEQTVREREEELRDFIENGAEGLHWVGADGTILWANQAELEMLGYTREEYLGRHIAEFHVDRPAIEDLLARLARNETIRNYEARLLAKDGSIRHVLISSNVLWRDGAFQHTRCFTRDITSRRLAEQDRARALQHLRAQYAVTRVLAEAQTLHEAAPRILQAVCETTGWTLGAIWQVDEPRRVIGCVDLWHAPGTDVAEFADATRRAALPPGVGLPGRVWASGAPAWIPDAVTDPNFPRAPHALRVGFHGAFGFPIRIKNQIAGVMEFFSSEVREPDEQLLQLFDAVGAQIGQFIERRRVDEARERLAAIVESSDDPIIGKTLDGIITSWNPAAERTFGFSAAEAVGQHVTLIIPADRHAEEQDVLRRLAEGQKIDHFATERQTRDGRRLAVSLTVSPIRNADGAPVGAATIVRDISGERRAQAALAESERRFRLIADSTPVLMWVNGVDGCEFVNRAYLEFFGAREEEIVGFGWAEYLHPDDRDAYIGAYRAAMAERGPFDAQVRIRRADGEFRWMRSYGVPRITGTGEFIGYVGASIDITDIRRAQDELQRSEREARFLADAGAALAQVADYRTTLQKVAELAVPTFADWCTVDVATDDGNLERLAVTHVDPEKTRLAYEITRRWPQPPDAPRGPRYVLGTGRSDMAEEIPDALLVQVAQDEEHLQTMRALGLRSFLSVPIRFDQKIYGVLTFVTAESGRRYDARDLQTADDLARRAAIAIENVKLYEKLQRAIHARDEFLSIAGHELRNPLNALQLQLVGLLRAAGHGSTPLPADRVMERIGQAADDVERLARLVHNLLDMTRITAGRLDLELEDVDLSGVVRAAADRLRPQLAEGQLSLRLTPVVGFWDRLRLDQIVTNLLSNAIKYGEGKAIEVSLETDGESARLAVTDHGIGIEDERQARIFDRFERGVSRRQYGGFGLGLWIARNLVEAMGGRIGVESRVGEGSTFRVTLPRRSPHA